MGEPDPRSPCGRPDDLYQPPVSPALTGGSGWRPGASLGHGQRMCWGWSSPRLGSMSVPRAGRPAGAESQAQLAPVRPARLLRFLAAHEPWLELRWRAPGSDAADPENAVFQARVGPGTAVRRDLSLDGRLWGAPGRAGSGRACPWQMVGQTGRLPQERSWDGSRGFPVAGGRDLEEEARKSGRPGAAGPSPVFLRSAVSLCPPVFFCLSFLPWGSVLLLTGSADCICHTDLRRSWRRPRHVVSGVLFWAPHPHSRGDSSPETQTTQGSAQFSALLPIFIETLCWLPLGPEMKARAGSHGWGTPCLGADLSWCVPLSSPRFSCPRTEETTEAVPARTS